MMIKKFMLLRTILTIKNLMKIQINFWYFFSINIKRMKNCLIKIIIYF